MINDSSSDDFMPMVYEIEEVECRMTDIEERDQKHDSAENNMNRSVRGSIFYSPKDFPLINPSRINDS